MSTVETTSSSEIRKRVQKQIAAAQGLRIESMERQGRVLIVKAVPATSPSSSSVHTK